MGTTYFYLTFYVKLLCELLTVHVIRTSMWLRVEIHYQKVWGCLLFIFISQYFIFNSSKFSIFTLSLVYLFRKISYLWRNCQLNYSFLYSFSRFSSYLNVSYDFTKGCENLFLTCPCSRAPNVSPKALVLVIIYSMIGNRF